MSTHTLRAWPQLCSRNDPGSIYCKDSASVVLLKVSSTQPETVCGPVHPHTNREAWRVSQEMQYIQYVLISSSVLLRVRLRTEFEHFCEIWAAGGESPLEFLLKMFVDVLLSNEILLYQQLWRLDLCHFFNEFWPNEESKHFIYC